MPGIESQKSMNYFLHDFSNHIPKPSGTAFNILGAKFASYSNFLFELGLSDLAKYDQQGVQVSNGDMDFPWRVRLQPSSEVNSLFPDNFDGRDFLTLLGTVPPGSILFNVYAAKTPALTGKSETEPQTYTEAYVGDIVLQSKLISSDWADKKLFFRHQNLDDDIILKPQWFSSATLMKEGQKIKIKTENKCPYH